MTGIKTTFRRDRLESASRSVTYAFLGCAFRCPDALLVEDLASSDRWEEALAALRSFDWEAVDQLARWRRRAFGSDADTSGVLANLRAAHVRLFGHAVRGACPPYEMEYGHGEIVQQAPELADISGFYAAFGLQSAPGARERADHVSAECEFMAVLAAKEAWAARERNGEALEVIEDAQARFLEEHLGRWLPALVRRLEQADPQGFYGTVARFAASFIEGECGRFGVAVGPPLLELRPADPERDASITCGVEESCPDAAAEPLVQIGIERT